MPEDKNPGDWAIEGIAKFDTKKTWKANKKNVDLAKQLKKGQICPEDFRGEKYRSAYAQGFCMQFLTTLKRAHRFTWRDHENVAARLVGALIIGLVLGCGMYNVNGMPEDFKLIVFQSVFYLIVVYCTESAAEEVPILVDERPTYYREVDSKFFSVLPYYVSRWLASQPILLLQAILVSVPLFGLALGSFPSFGRVNDDQTPIDASAGERVLDFLLFYVETYLALTVSATFSQLFAAASPNEGVGNVLYFTVCCLSRLFSGFIVNLSQMGGVPPGYAFIRWLGRLSNLLDFFKYAFYTFGDSFINGTPVTGPPKQGTGVVLRQLGEEQNPIWLQLVNPYPNAEGRSYWMPHLWFREPSQFIRNGQDWGQRYQFMLGLGAAILLFNIVTFLLLRFKRWDKR